MGLSGVEWANLYASVGRSETTAVNAANHSALLQMARHLRWEHGLSRRKVARRLLVSEKWVKEFVDDWTS